jgi:hypothetical protein
MYKKKEEEKKTLEHQDLQQLAHFLSCHGIQPKMNQKHWNQRSDITVLVYWFMLQYVGGAMMPFLKNE